MAEQLAFQQRRGKRAAMHRQERFRAAWREFVDLPREMRLARTGLAGDQNRGFQTGDRLKLPAKLSHGDRIEQKSVRVVRENILVLFAL
jgi:hypothetical protein